MSTDQFPSHWQLLPLSEAVDALIDYRGKTPKKTSHGVPLITAKIVKGGTILPATEYIAEEDYDSWMVRGLPKAGDVVVTTEAPLGEVAQLADENVALAQRIVTLRGAEGLLKNDYLRYVMQGAYVQGQLESRASGSTVKGIKQSELRKVILPIPPEHEQNKIAVHLSALDEKIQLNQQINQTLEQMAQAIFKSWFVDFEPVKAKIAALEAGGSEEDALLAAMQVIAGDAQGCANAAGGRMPGAAKGDKLTRLQTEQPEQYAELRATAELFPSAMQDSELGEIPEGWKSGFLSDICDFQNGYAFKSKDWAESGFAVVKIGSVKPEFVDIQASSYVREHTVSGLERFELHAGDLLVGMTGYPGESGLVPMTENRIFLNQRVGRLKPRHSHQKALLYCNVRNKAFKQYVQGQAHGSAQANVSGRAIGEYPLTLPPDSIGRRFSTLIEPILRQKLMLNAESSTLASLRDTLLPKLISGELSPEGMEAK